MFRYILKRVFFAILALLVLMILVFFLMQAVPGYSLRRPQNMTDEQYFLELEKNGLLQNPIVQFFDFIGGLFQGRFGVVYNTEGANVIEKTLLPMKYTIMIAFPAFILSSIIGIGLGILSARFRGKAVDIVINGIAVLFLAIPSFIFALYLVKLAGLIGLPTKFIIPGNGTPLEVFLSMIMPILAMTLSSISVILYYTRNELVDVFKQEYIKTALAKGCSFTKIIFTHAIRNALIPILAVLLPSFISILTGSIIVERFFSVPGTSSILINAIQDKEIYIVLFCTLFYSGIYFALQILVDISFVFIDPRIKLGSSNSKPILKILKAKKAILNNKKEIFNLDYSYYNCNKNLNLNKNFNFNNEIKTQDDNLDLPTKIEIQTAYNEIFKTTQTTQDYNISNFMQSKIKNDSFCFVDSLAYNNEQIVGKPTTYIKDVFKRFCKSKVALFFSLVLIVIIMMSIIISLATPNSTNQSIGNLTVGLVDYLPPRIPFLGLTGIVSERLVSQEVFYGLQQMQNELGVQIFTNYVQEGSSFLIYNYNPYVLPSLRDVYPIMGTDGLGRDWWSMLWYSTAKSLILAIIASAGSVVIGTIYGSIAGSFAGKATDTILMRIVEIISGVPLIIWVLIISIIVSGGTLDIFTLSFSLIITSWMGSAIIARTFIIKYKDAEFVQAAKTLGASQFRIIFSHLLPNIIGRLAVVFVNRIPVIIFFETSLVFLGLKSSSEVSLGTMINVAWQDVYPYLLVGPTLNLVLTTLSSIIIANNLNDSIDPRITN